MNTPLSVLSVLRLLVVLTSCLPHRVTFTTGTRVRFLLLIQLLIKRCGNVESMFWIDKLTAYTMFMYETTVFLRFSVTDRVQTTSVTMLCSLRDRGKLGNKTTTTLLKSASESEKFSSPLACVPDVRHRRSTPKHHDLPFSTARPLTCTIHMTFTHQ